jgi:thioredoxin-dependent peroxiredoxin
MTLLALIYRHPNSFNEKEDIMAIRLGDIVPNFTAESTKGPIDFHKAIEGGWTVLFSHPKDYTPVCTTELGRVAKLKGEFEKRGVKVFALSVDKVADHNGWINDINETQHTTVDYPIIGDPDRKIANLYDMIHPNAIDNMTVRSVFIIGPDKKLKLSLTYPASTGRNFTEILRVIDSLQLTAKYSLATPADWNPGQECIIATSVTDEDAAKKFPGYKTIKPYLRVTPQPRP